MFPSPTTKKENRISFRRYFFMTTSGKIALFLGGALFGSAGLKILSSRDARKVYTHITAATLRCKDEVMRHVELVQEGCSDILADAQELNAARDAEPEIIEDAQTAEADVTEA
jgi:hypothetical protein